MTFGTTLGEDLTMAFSTNKVYIAINYKKEQKNMKVEASNINIKIYQLFSKQRILSARCTTGNLSGLDTNLLLNKRVDHNYENNHKIDLDIFK